MITTNIRISVNKLILIFTLFLFFPITAYAEEKTIDIFSATELQSALNDSSNNGAILKLQADIEGIFTYEKNKQSITLDLNNHGIKGFTSDDYLSCVIVIRAGTFTLTDNSLNKTRRYYKLEDDLAVLTDINDDIHYFEGGYITGGKAKTNDSGGGGGIYVCHSLDINKEPNEVKFIMQSGTIIGNLTNFGAGISGENIEINGGNIIGNKSIHNGGGIEAKNIVINNCNIFDNTSEGDGGGIAASNCIINNAFISRNHGRNGGGIFVSKHYPISESDYGILINGGEITNNTAEQGGGLCITQNPLTMTGGVIKHNISEGYGGGVCNNGKDIIFEMSGGTIEENESISNEGGGASLSNDAKMILSGGTISNNIGGGIINDESRLYVYGGKIINNNGGGIIDHGRIFIKESPYIQENYKTEDGFKINCNIMFCRSKNLIFVIGKLNTDTNIGISLESPLTYPYERILTDGLSGNGSFNYFKNDSSKYELFMKDSELAIRNSASNTETQKTSQGTPKVVLISAKNNKKKAITIKWKQVKGIKHYALQYAQNKKFTKNLKWKYIRNTSTSVTLKKLKKKKTYYIRIKAIPKTGADGPWSKIKKVKIKK